MALAYDAGHDPYDVPEDLRERVDALDLRGNVRDLVDNGYTVIQDPVAHGLTDEVRAAILRLVQETDAPLTGYSAGLLLGRDPVFAKAVLVPKLAVLTEYLLGRGALLSQLIGTVRKASPAFLGLHADNSWFPEPFPNWEIMATACWVTDDFTKDGGATMVIPGTHKLKRHPPPSVRKSLEGVVPIVAPKGSLCLWDGSVWHGNYPRQIPGERVVLHMTYTRVGMQPVEDYSHLGADWLAGQPDEMANLLGRRLFLGSTTAKNGAVDGARLQTTYRMVHGPKGYTGVERRRADED